VTLTDGSRIVLGGDTAIRYWLDDKRRHVEVQRGEAFFTVAKDPGRPFEVQAGRTTVTAVGTAFNVRRGAERVVVAVVEGRVKIADDEHSQPIHVSAGEQTVVDKSQASLAVSPASTAAATAWQVGRQSFDHEPLRYVLENVNRYSRTPIVLADPSIGELLITGSVLNDNVAGWVKSLELAFGLEAVTENERIVLRRLGP
jgi:transmembrane sensor